MNPLRQFTASTYIIKNRETLLLFHKKLQKWLPPGGHVDPNETCQEAAVREVKEETGYDVSLISFQNNLTICENNARSLPSPFLCLLEEIPAYGDQPYHQHMDYIFMAEITGGKLKENLDESSGLKWFSLDKLDELQGNPLFFQETLQVLDYISNNTPIAVTLNKS